MEEQILNRIITFYKEKQGVYEEYCNAMKNLLVHLLNNNGYKYQISHRVKSIDSLEKKIRKKSKEGIEINQLEDINDLAGVRIVFYLESDKNKFVSDLYRELTPKKLKLKERHIEKGYRSTHVIAALGQKRLILGEYKKFKGLKCEIQLTSALYHAWSEIEHDIFYKPCFQEKEYRADIIKLKKELENVMTEYIQKASDIFEYISKKVNERK
ncbi:MAG: RelA/SpoT domain-containing protein [Leptospiraceae bacterium]|nr:RelA/SpoT domain-containing protein [Leptospiraceae bacterium]MBK7054279.1 RelA/SpoT domain-containing protein [Leptospiraceae bacterium]MBK9499599.1 RelA/SpoT domain-containing protein [Leptospiraceae bacterium]MBP9163004.1 RelA/SpoT domain-containing protein [Leptospiraceae bacterium]